jgi:transposase
LENLSGEDKMQARQIELHYQTRCQLERSMKAAEQDGVYRVAKRIHAVLLNAKGKTSGDIADILNSPRSSVSEWLRNYEQFGYDGLLEGHRSGRKSELTQKQKIQLADIIESGPVAYGFVPGVWTSIMIAQIIEEEFSVHYHHGHVRRMLYDLGFSMQRPKKILAKADVDAQKKWCRYTYPNIKKKRAQLMQE